MFGLSREDPGVAEISFESRFVGIGLARRFEVTARDTEASGRLVSGFKLVAVAVVARGGTELARCRSERVGTSGSSRGSCQKALTREAIPKFTASRELEKEE